MTDDAFKLADSIRYLDDTRSRKRFIEYKNLNQLDLAFSMKALRVSEKITPTIHQALSLTCKRLKLNVKKVIMYVTPSSDIQASCISIDSNSCLVTVSSELVKLLDLDELIFVIGHELGHFLLFHNIEEVISSKETLIKNRAREISVDRIGLLACKEIDVALRAIIKTLSGLSGEYLNLDINAFLNQIDQNPESIPGHYLESSHPSLVLRAKALVRFSFSHNYKFIKGEKSGRDIIDIDQEIKSDLDIYGDSQIREEIDALKNLLVFWIISYSMIRSADGFTLRYQNLIVEKFDEKRKDKLIAILSSYDNLEEREDFIKNKVIESYENFTIAAPNASKKEFNLIIEEVMKDTGYNNLITDLQRLI